MRCLYPLSLALIAGCGPVPAPAPAGPPPAIAARLPEPPLAPAPKPVGDWRDWPLTPGIWVYRQDTRGSIALFGVPGVDAALTLRCDTAARQIYLSRKGEQAPNAAFILRTTSTVRMLASQPTGGTPTYRAVALNPADGVLDAIAFSRGRFVLEAPDMAVLVVPAWSEIARVTEDCR